MSIQDQQAENMENLELKISHLLRIGVIVAGAVLLIGWIGLIRGPSPFEKFATYTVNPLTHALSTALARHDYSLLIGYLGLFILISLPMLRVLFTCLLFLRGKDYILAAVAGFVLIALLTSFSLGLEL